MGMVSIAEHGRDRRPLRAIVDPRHDHLDGATLLAPRPGASDLRRRHRPLGFPSTTRSIELRRSAARNGIKSRMRTGPNRFSLAATISAKFRLPEHSTGKGSPPAA